MVLVLFRSVCVCVCVCVCAACAWFYVLFYRFAQTYPQIPIDYTQPTTLSVFLKNFYPHVLLPLAPLPGAMFKIERSIKWYNSRFQLFLMLSILLFISMLNML